MLLSSPNQINLFNKFHGYWFMVIMENVRNTTDKFNIYMKRRKRVRKTQWGSLACELFHEHWEMQNVFVLQLQLNNKAKYNSPFVIQMLSLNSLICICIQKYRRHTKIDEGSNSQTRIFTAFRTYQFSCGVYIESVVCVRVSSTVIT